MMNSLMSLRISKVINGEEEIAHLDMAPLSTYNTILEELGML